ncbi:MAG: putative zinc-binding protein [Candidatus Aminicenantes bacterium]|nr:putative zinc-binding protein [Candidatus Aminicenantes bacterium]
MKKNYTVVGFIGRSNVGQMSARLAIELDKMFSNVNIRCLPALSGDASPAKDKFFEDDGIIVIDGCKLRCISKTLKNYGLGDKIVRHYVLDEDFQIEKTPGLNYDEDVFNKVLEKIANDLRKLE